MGGFDDKATPNAGTDGQQQKEGGQICAPSAPLLEEMIDEWKLARMLGVSVKLLARWRRNGGGPAFIQVARTSVRYTASDVQKWIEERRLTKKGQSAE